MVEASCENALREPSRSNDRHNANKVRASVERSSAISGIRRLGLDERMRSGKQGHVWLGHKSKQED